MKGMNIFPKVFKRFTHSSNTPTTLKPHINFKKIKEDVNIIRENINIRKANADVDKVVSLYEKHRTMLFETESISKRRNEIARLLSKSNDQTLVEEAKELKSKQTELEKHRLLIEQDMYVEALKIPNDTHPSSPRNSVPKLIKMVGNKPDPSYKPLDHMELAKKYDLITFPQLSGSSKFYYGKNEIALLETALINWAMITVSQKYGFTPYTTPDIVSIEFAKACGFQPRTNATQMYSIENEELCLVGTQEIPLAALYSNTILSESQLPIKMVGYGHCFRHETGSNVSDKGIYRVHQFSKVEMFIICKPEDSEKIHNELLEIEIDLLSSLGLHFKVLEMPSDDLGASAYRKYDIEAWMPYKEDYGEVTSCSNCTDYQSRRLSTRFRPSQGGPKAPLQFVHTLNATAIAVPRIILSILENFQEGGKIKIPEPLIPFMGGKQYISLEQ